MKRPKSERHPAQLFAPLVLILHLFFAGCAAESAGTQGQTQVAQAAPATNVTSAVAQQPIHASQAPGQYDVLEGTAVQLRAQSRESGAQQGAAGGAEIKGYRWEIVEGQGGRLLNAESPTVTFYAPSVARDVETFAVKLTTEYVDGATSSATLLIRVHKNAPKGGADRAYERRYGYSPWFYGGIGFGFGYLWNYPIYIPIIIPWPGDELLPEDLEPIPPEALLPGEIDELPDDLVPDVVLPPGVDFPDEPPDLGVEPVGIEPIGIEPVPEGMMETDPSFDAPLEPMPEPMPEPVDPGFGGDFGGGDFGGGDFGGGDGDF